MFIGLTYDLRSEYLAAGYGEEETAEFDRAETIDCLEGALRELGHETDRIGHARQLVERLAAGDRWDLVFNICEGMYGLAREAQVPAILDVYNIAYTFSDPLVMALCLHKGLTKTVLQAAGVPTSKHMVISNSEFGIQNSESKYPSPEPLVPSPSSPLFIKPVAEGTGKGVNSASIVRDEAALRQGCQRLLQQFRQGVLVEEFLPGREFTVGLTGTGDDAMVVGTLEIVLRANAEPGVYSYLNKEESEERVDMPFVSGQNDPVVAEAEAIALRAWRALGGRDAGRIDLRCDSAGHPQFIEVNPLAGLHPTHSDLPMVCTAAGISYTELIRRIVDSAARRVTTQVATSRRGGASVR